MKPTTRDAITAALKECGPMSVPELMEHLGFKRNRINTAMTTARANHPGVFFRIVSYRKQIGVSGRETPVYSASKGPDAPRPDFGEAHRLERNARYYQQNRARLFIERQVRAGVPAASPWAGLIPIERRVTRSAQHPAH